MNFNLEIKTNKCPLFLAKKACNVTIKESPDFIKNRLIASGIRPINNVVDISNYVMLEIGQPLHFYDNDNLGNKIVVRMANDGEELTTLDNENRVLSSDDILITDGEKAVGLAPSGIRKFFDVVSEMPDAISLGVGEPDFETPWHIRDEGIYSLEKGRKCHFERMKSFLSTFSTGMVKK